MSRSYKYAVLSWPGINKLPDFPDFSLTCSCAGIPVSFASQYRTPFAVLSCKSVTLCLSAMRPTADYTMWSKLQIGCLINLCGNTATITDANILLNLRSMQEVDDKKLSDLSKRFLQAISYCGLSGYKLKKDNIISSESTLTSIKKGIQLPSKKQLMLFVRSMM